MTPPTTIPSPRANPTTQQIGGYVSVVWRRRQQAGTVAVAVLVFALASRVVWPSHAEVSSRLLRISADHESLSSALAKLPLAGMAGVGGAKQSDPVQALLATRELKAGAARRIAPDSTARVERAADPLRALGYKLSVSEAEGGALRLTVRGATAAAAERANQAVLDALAETLRERTLTDTRQQRIYTEKLLEENATRRRELEEALMGFSPDSSVAMDPEVEGLLSRVSALRERAAGQRIAAEALASASASSAGTATVTRPLLDEAASLQAQAATLAMNVKLDAHGTVVVPVARVPLVALEYRRLEGELRVLDQIYALLQEQREMASIQEARDAPSFTVIDPPVAAAATVEPSLKQWVTLSAFSAFFAGIGAAFFAEWWSLEGDSLLDAVRGEAEGA